MADSVTFSIEVVQTATKGTIIALRVQNQTTGLWYEYDKSANPQWAGGLQPKGNKGDRFYIAVFVMNTGGSDGNISLTITGGGQQWASNQNWCISAGQVGIEYTTPSGLNSTTSVTVSASP